MEYLIKRVDKEDLEEVYKLFFNDNKMLHKYLHGNYREVRQILSRYRLRKYLDGVGMPPAK